MAERYVSLSSLREILGVVQMSETGREWWEVDSRRGYSEGIWERLHQSSVDHVVADGVGCVRLASFGAPVVSMVEHQKNLYVATGDEIWRLDGDVFVLEVGRD